MSRIRVWIKTKTSITKCFSNSIGSLDSELCYKFKFIIPAPFYIPTYLIKLLYIRPKLVQKPRKSLNTLGKPQKISFFFVARPLRPYPSPTRAKWPHFLNGFKKNLFS